MNTNKRFKVSKAQIAFLISFLFIGMACNQKKQEEDTEKEEVQASEEAAYDTTSVYEFMEFIDQTDMNIQAPKTVLNYFQAEFDKTDKKTNDQAFAEYFQFLVNLQNELNRKIRNDTNYESYKSLITDPENPSEEAFFLKTQLLSNGFIIDSVQSELYIDIDPRFLSAHFHGFLSEGMDIFLQAFALEKNEGLVEEGLLLIPIKTLCDRLLFWEIFTRDYPDLPVYHLANNYHRFYLSILLNGVEKEPNYDGNLQIEQEYLEAYHYLTAKYAGTQTAATIEEFLQLLDDNDFKIQGTAAAFAEENEF